MKNYGKELILDLHECGFERVTKKYLTKFLKELVEKIDMEACKLTFWEYDNEDEYNNAPPHLKGISAVQFISTSNITIHALDDLKRVYLNIFSCKDFNVILAMDYCEKYFGGKVVMNTIIDRL